MPSSSVLILYLAKDYNLKKQAEFLRVATRLGERYGTAPVPIFDAGRILDAAESRSGRSVDHLITLCHGFPDRLFRHDMGVSTKTERRPEVIHIKTFARAWAPKLKDGAKISLGACLTGRDPRWYIVKKWGAALDQWSPYANQDGGEKSLAGILRDELLDPTNPDHLTQVSIRAHTVAGHITEAAPMREFVGPIGTSGKALFRLALPGVEPTWAACKWWNNTVRGALAEDLILFSRNDGDIFKDVQALWQKTCPKP